MPSLISRQACTITSGQSLSAAITMNGLRISVIEMSAAWTPAILSFQGSSDGTNFFNIYDEAGKEVYAVADVSLRVHVDKVELSQLKAIKVRSGLSGSAVVQGGTRVLYLEVWS